MDKLSSFKKTFKSHGSHKHARRISAGAGDDIHEEQPILSDHQDMRSSLDDGRQQGHREVIVKIDDTTTSDQSTSKIWRESSYDFWQDGQGVVGAGGGHGFGVPEDPTSKLIGQFLNKQKETGGEMSLDMDLEMDELRHNRHNPPMAETPMANRTINSSFTGGDSNNYRGLTSKDLKVSFQGPSSTNNVVDIQPEPIDTRSSDDSGSSDGEASLKLRASKASASPAPDDRAAEVIKCTSFQRRKSMLRTKTQSRLIDPLPHPVRNVREGPPKYSGQMRSGMLGRISGVVGGTGQASEMLGKPTGEDEEDPLFDEDLPDDYTKTKINAITIIQWVSLIVIVAVLVCTLCVRKWKQQEYRGLELWKWEVLVLVLICGRLVSGWAIRIIVFFIERNFLLRKRVLYFVYGIRKAVQNCIWLGLVLLAWHYMFDKKVDSNKFLRYVNKLMVCMLVATLLWLVKTLMVKVLASSFHVSTFFDRIQESVFNQYVIETLSGPPVIEIQNNQEEEERTMAEVWKLQNAGASVPPDLKATAFPGARSVRVIGSSGLQRGMSIKHSGMLQKKQGGEGIPIDHLHKLNPKNISAWNMKRLMNIVRYGTLSTLDEQIRDTSREDESAKEIRSEFEAKLAARKIFRNVTRPRSKYIYLEDLMRFLREDEALKAMNLLAGSSETEKVSKAALKNWVVNAFRERRALALTLNDTKTAVNKLHQMVNVLVGIIILVICLLILGIATSKYLLFASSQIVVVAFIFGNTCKTVFEAIIFVFVMHPFDVGDRCEVDGVQMIVEEMNILTTAFLRFDNQKIIFPNSTLATRPISNYYRSPDMGDSVDFNVHVTTPAEKINLMKQRIISFIENKKDHWYPAPTIVTMNLEELNTVKMSVWMRHRMNHQDMVEKWLRRALLVDEMIKIFKELDIEYRLYPLDINIRAMPTPSSTRLPMTWPASTKC